MSKSSAMIRAVRGPILLIALGALTAADTFGTYSLTRTWPVLLILFGLMKLAEKAAESGDIDGPGGGYPQGPAYAGNTPYPGQPGYQSPLGHQSPIGNPAPSGYQPSGANVPPTVVDVKPQPVDPPKSDI
jgi:hypothetical protein